MCQTLGGGGVIWKICIWFSLERFVEIRGTECCVRVNRNLVWFFFIVLPKINRAEVAVEPKHNTFHLLSAHNRKIPAAENTTFWSVSPAKTYPFIRGFRSGQVCINEMGILSISTSFPHF